GPLVKCLYSFAQSGKGSRGPQVSVGHILGIPHASYRRIFSRTISSVGHPSCTTANGGSSINALWESAPSNTYCVGPSDIALIVHRSCLHAQIEGPGSFRRGKY